jgi:hypothetical protein
MPPAKLAASTALLGGLLWIAHALLGGGSDPVPGTLHFLGLAALILAAGVFGSTLGRSDAVAMRLTGGLALLRGRGHTRGRPAAGAHAR